LTNTWDNSDDVLRYSQSQDNARAMWDRLNKRYPTKGESYSELSELFNKVFFHYLQNTYHHEIHWRTVVLPGYAGDRNGQLPLKRYLWRNNGRLWQRCKVYLAEDAFKFPRTAK